MVANWFTRSYHARREDIADWRLALYYSRVLVTGWSSSQNKMDVANISSSNPILSLATGMRDDEGVSQLWGWDRQFGAPYVGINSCHLSNPINSLWFIMCLSLSIHLAKGLGIYITKWLWSWRVRLWNWPPLALPLLNRSWAAHRRFEATTLRRISNCDRNKSCRKGLWGIICHNTYRYIYIYRYIHN